MIEVRYVPLGQFMLWLAQGWRFSRWIAEPMHGHHGCYSCLMERDIPDET